MAVQVNRSPDGSLQLLDQRISIEWRKQPRHILDAESVGAQVFQLLGQLDKPIQAVDRTERIADRGLHVLPAGFHLAHGRFHIPEVVESVEDPKHVDAVEGGPFDEPLQHIVRIVPVAHDVLPAQEHLQPGVRHGCAQAAEPFPGIFLQEAQACVESCAAPDFEGPIADRVQFLRDGQHILSAHTGREQGLMTVPQDHIGDQEPFRRGRLQVERT